jgi:hypothetical protein
MPKPIRILSKTQTTSWAHNHTITGNHHGDVQKNVIPNTLGVTWSIAYCQNHLVNRKTAIIVKLILHIGNTCCPWAGGATEFSRIIDRICWSCAFFLTYQVCLGIFDQICWALAFFLLIPKKLILVGLSNQRCQYQEVSIVALIIGINRFSAD